jgi:uncharacterized protein YbgA (DUF1722 family)
MGIPREPMRLVGDPRAPRLVTVHGGRDLTDRMRSWIRSRIQDLASMDLCGFVFKSDSPSCGMVRVKVHAPAGLLARRGMFARAFLEAYPLLPAEDEGRLHDPTLRDNFLDRIFTVRRWKEALQSARTRGVLVDFHTRNKLLVLAHSTRHYQALGRLVADAKNRGAQELFAEYERILMEGLRLKATPRKNANVLRHILGYFKKELSAEEKQELLDAIERYRNDLVPLIVPMSLVNHYVHRYDEPYPKLQAYLSPYPAELQLRKD